jgi:hypothetical protein
MRWSSKHSLMDYDSYKINNERKIKSEMEIKYGKLNITRLKVNINITIKPRRSQGT